MIWLIMACSDASSWWTGLCAWGCVRGVSSVGATVLCAGGHTYASPVNTLVKKEGRSGFFAIWDKTFLTGKRLEVTIGLL